ncbi:hypothetical protein OHT76_01690 [Streptomyces sp. NBC_00287]|nr:hypothetical protein [Streptomyces sp. NBC_00287]
MGAQVSLRADFSVLESYEYVDEPPLPVFAGSADALVTPATACAP